MYNMIRNIGITKGILKTDNGKNTVDALLPIIKNIFNELNVSYQDTCCNDSNLGYGGCDPCGGSELVLENVGSGEGVWKETVDNVASLKSITSDNQDILVSSDDNSIIISPNFPVVSIVKKPVSSVFTPFVTPSRAIYEYYLDSTNGDFTFIINDSTKNGCIIVLKKVSSDNNHITISFESSLDGKSSVLLVNQYDSITITFLNSNVAGVTSQYHLISKYPNPINSKVTLTDSNAIDWDFTTGNVAYVVLGGNRTLNITNIDANSFGVIYFQQDSAGSRSITLPSGSLKPATWSLSTAANTLDSASFFYDGTNFFWDNIAKDIS